MAVEAVSTYQNGSVVTNTQPVFKGKTEIGSTYVKEYPDFYEKTTVTEAAKGKKLGVGIASAFIPGLGQFINDDVGKGIGYLGAAGGFWFFAKYLSGDMKMIQLINNAMNALKGSHGKTSKGLIFGAIACGLAALATHVVSAVDAVKNARSKVKSVEYKDK